MKVRRWGAKASALWASLVLVLAVFSAYLSGAQAAGPSQARAVALSVGDEDPFPLRCVDFSGKWRSDSGASYKIGQYRCKWLEIAMSFGAEQISLTIVPDNRVRTMPGIEGKVRHRWNSPRYGSIIEAHMSFLEGTAHVSEVITYEMVTPNLLLETTYRTIECTGLSKPRRETEQQVFRRIQPEKPSQGKWTKGK